MTDEDLTQAGEARERARVLLAQAAERRIGAVPVPQAQPEPTPGPLERIGGLHDLLRDTAAYLGDRPQKDAEAMGLYGRVMAMLGSEGEAR